jgi:hypothetical protein
LFTQMRGLKLEPYYLFKRFLAIVSKDHALSTLATLHVFVALSILISLQYA